MAGLRGRVVLVDFWTYSCINCQRSLPHVEAWNAAYAKDGLTVVGVHTPEFAFEHDVPNIRAAAPAGRALPDRRRQPLRHLGQLPELVLAGRIPHRRHRHCPPRRLRRGCTTPRPSPSSASSCERPTPGSRSRPGTDVADRTPQVQTTPESYLGLPLQRAQPVRGERHPRRHGRLPGTRRAAPGHLRLRRAVGHRLGGGHGRWGRPSPLHFQAHDVYLVLGGSGTCRSRSDGVPTRTVVGRAASPGSTSWSARAPTSGGR